MARLACGLDLGGSGVRCLVVDLETGRRWSARRPLRLVPAGPWSWDLDLEATWSAALAVLRGALEAAGSGEVVGISSSCMRQAMVVLGSEVVLLATPNIDARGAGQAEQLAETGENRLRRTGRWPDPASAAARLVWLRDEGRIGLARHFLSLGDWLSWKLCGALAAERSQAGESGLLTLAGRWDRNAIEQLELPVDIFPELVQAGAELGGLSAEAASLVGLPAGTPVHAGGGDTPCALLGAGVAQPGQAGIVAGTTCPIQHVVGVPKPERQLRLGHHVVAGRWLLEKNQVLAGQVLGQLAAAFFEDHPAPVARLMEVAKDGRSAAVASMGATPFRADQLSLPVMGLHLSPFQTSDARADLARAAVDAVCRGIAQNIPGEPEQLRVTGGLSQSRWFVEQLAGHLGTPVLRTLRPESSALGAAMLACPDGVAACEHLVELESVSPASVREPSPTLLRAFADLEPEVAGELVSASFDDQPQDIPHLPEALRIYVSASVDEDSLARLRSLGEVVYAPYREVQTLLTGEALVEALQGVHVFVTEVDVVDLEALEELPQLRVIACCRGRVVNVDVASCTALGIPVLGAPGRNAEAVADFTVAASLALLRKLVPADRFLRSGVEAGDMGRMGMAHEAFQGFELGGRTVGLIGFGAVARAVARRLRSFGSRVIAFDPFVPDQVIWAGGAEPVSLEALLQRSDVVSLHAAATDETRGIIGRQALSAMKESALLINTARAALVDQDALVDALRSGGIAGACLDVFAVEPPGSDEPLLQLDNVLALPHIAGNTHDVGRHQGRIVVEGLEALLRGERPRTLLNDVLEGFSWDQRPEADAEELEALRAGPGPGVTDLEIAATASLPEISMPTPELMTEPAPESGFAALVAAFCGLAESDPDIQAFATGRDITAQYLAPDADVGFHMVFRDGRAVVRPAPYAGKPDVTVKMNAEVMDGVFGGEVNGMKAAMTGKLSFMGNTVKAMTMQRVQPQMTRQWLAARERVGELDFSRPEPTRSQISPIEGDDGILRGALAAGVGELVEAGLITSTGGNVSIRVGPERALLTPSQLFKGDLRPELMVLVDLDGEPLQQVGAAPTSERMIHCSILKARPDVGAVVHSHAPMATTLDLAGLPFLPISTEAAFVGEIPRVCFTMPGTDELAGAIVQALGSGSAVIMSNHGLVVAGSSLRRALDLTHIIEDTAAKLIDCQKMGRVPPVLPPETVEMLQSIGELIA